MGCNTILPHPVKNHKNGATQSDWGSEKKAPNLKLNQLHIPLVTLVRSQLTSYTTSLESVHFTVKSQVLSFSQQNMATEDSVPVVDFKNVFSCQDLSTRPEVQELHHAFTKVGFVYIKNHGIDQKLVSNKNSSSWINSRLCRLKKHTQWSWNSLPSLRKWKRSICITWRRRITMAIFPTVEKGCFLLTKQNERR